MLGGNGKVELGREKLQYWDQVRNTKKCLIIFQVLSLITLNGPLETYPHSFLIFNSKQTKFLAPVGDSYYRGLNNQKKKFFCRRYSYLISKQH